MEAFITSCNRPDLMTKTVASLIESTPISRIVINEDGNDLDYDHRAFMGAWPQTNIYLTKGIGQHASISQYLKSLKDDYYLHSEEDWFFFPTYDWISVSLKLMEEYPNVIKVLARKDSPHKCVHDQMIDGIPYGFLEPWMGNDGVRWHGFSWNPGVTFAPFLREFLPFPKFEQDLAEKIHARGYAVIELGIPVYEHIGDGRSTH
jgi:hypothetical protein